MSQFKIDKQPFWAGWAMDAYPEMSTDELRCHIARQRDAGCTFVWGGHNNPGEVDREKIEPGMSYSIYAALMNKQSPLHDAAQAIYDAQLRLLEACRKEHMPIVFPIGYQIQMGEEWNALHPDHLRRTREGEIVNWGGKSACFYSPQYQEDIRRFYAWIAEDMIKPFHDVICMVNLADEPFGGDYSKFAEEEFQRRTGHGFAEAMAGGAEGLRALGEFQAHYIADYAGWSARAWAEVDPARPTTMSLCGHHGREDYAMPYIPAVFSLTPETFYPTWDVYPRDGHFYNPVKETDITPLLLFLQQVAWLAARHNRPYFYWTTGNSWGLGQSSPDKANIADALVNQLYVLDAARRHDSPLRGVAIWNYNIKFQGLYNDTNPIIYDPDDMFEKLSGGLKGMRAAMNGYAGPSNGSSGNGASAASRCEAVITASRDYLFRFVAVSGKSVYPFPFALAEMHRWAKSGARIRMTETIAEGAAEAESLASSGADINWVIMTDEDDAELKSNGTWQSLGAVAKKCRRVALPAAALKRGVKDGMISAADAKRFCAVGDGAALWKAGVWNEAFGALPERGVYGFPFGTATVYYNLTLGDVRAADVRKGELAADEVVLVICPEARVIFEGAGPAALGECPPIAHHGLCVIGTRDDFFVELMADICQDSKVAS